MYDDILRDAAALSKDVETERLSTAEACETLLDTWEGIRGDRVSAKRFHLVLPAPLIWTGTVDLPNDEDRRSEAVERILNMMRALTEEELGDRIESWRSWLAGIRATEPERR
jgi:hypothetical protein